MVSQYEEEAPYPKGGRYLSPFEGLQRFMGNSGQRGGFRGVWERGRLKPDPGDTRRADLVFLGANSDVCLS